MRTREQRQELAKSVRYTHFNVGKGAATLATTSDGKRVYYGIAMCSPQDNFCRRRGRELAHKRLFSQGTPHTLTEFHLSGSKATTQYNAETIQNILFRTVAKVMDEQIYMKRHNSWLVNSINIISFRTRRAKSNG